MKRNLIALFVILLACGTSFAYTSYDLVPEGTSPQGGGGGLFDLPAPSAVTYYNTEGDFLAAAGAVVNESFTNSSAEPGGVCSALAPLNSATNDGCFAAGAVLDGFSLMPLTGDYVVLGSNFFAGQTVPAVGPNTFTDSMDLSFSPASAAIGFLVFGDLVGPLNVDIAIYDGGGALLDTVTVTGTVGGTFIGMVSDDPIGLLEFRAIEADGGELIGNMYFGGGGGDGGGDGGDGAVPATSTWGVILLIALFMGISLFYLRRRSNA